MKSILINLLELPAYIFLQAIKFGLWLAFGYCMIYGILIVLGVHI